MARSLDADATPAQGLGMFRELLRAMRPKDWLKNAFVFAAIAFARDPLTNQPLWWQFDKILLTIGAFVCFCMAASAIYLLNDLVDIEKDRAHPKKRNRPLASGRLGPRVAVIATVILLILALPGAFLLDLKPERSLFANLNFGFTMVAYVLIQGVVYSYYLKHVVILDIFTIAAGFVLRAVAGAFILDVPITPWLLICMGLLALFLGMAKRRAELVLLQGGAGEHRKILDEYSLPLLDQMMSIVTAATIVAYTLFTTTAETLPLRPFPFMMVTVPFVIYAIFRYLYLVYKQDGGGNPAELLLNDRPLAVCIVLWGIISVAVLALPHA
jgi:4-hydroxybenzoate polyprenyltransferase